MRFLGIIIAFLVAFGAVLPHAASAHEHPGMTTHEMGKHHPVPTKDATDCKTNCIGCAAPVRMAAAPEAPPVPVGSTGLVLPTRTLTGFVAPLELRPPRLIA